MSKKIWRRVRALLRKEKLEQEMDAELRFHLEMETERNIKRGMNPEEACSVALRAFGNMEKVKEECRDARGGRFLEALWQDSRYGLRMLRKSPGFTVVAVLTLALGIGANTAIFSIVNGVLLRSLPYQQGERLVVLRQQMPGAKIDDLRFSVQEILDFRHQTQTMDEVVEFHNMEFTLLGKGEPQQVRTGVVSANFFEVLGVKPLLGRTFLPGEDQPGTEPIMVLSYEFWRDKQGGDPNIIDQKFGLSGNVHTVVGVLPLVPQYPVEVDVYMPTSHCPTRSSQRFIENRQARMMRVFGRLKPGVTPEQAQSDVARIAATIKHEHPDVYSDHTGYSVVSPSLKVELTKQARRTLLILLLAAGFVLLIACANVANLMLSRILRRERELAVRAALGASRSRLLRQLVTESTMLAVAGGAIGLFLALLGMDSLITFADRFTPRAHEISIDHSVLLYTLIISIVTGIAFGAIPALKSQPVLTTTLNEAGSRSSTGTGAHRIRSFLVVAQVAVSLVLLTGAGLMLRSLLKLQHVDPGFNPENVISMRVGLNWLGFDRSMERRMQFFRSLLERLEGTPGVVSTAVVSAFPLSHRQGFPNTFEIEGRRVPPRQAQPVAEVDVASPSYFHTVDIPLVRGRFFADSDGMQSPPVAVISQSLARRHWEGGDPIGKRVSLDQGATWLTIVGVVGDARQFGLDKEPADQIYVSFWQGQWADELLVRTTADPVSMSQTLIKTIREMAPDQTIDTIQTLEQARSDSMAPTRLTTILIGLFAVLALAITVAGIGGVMALMVGQRTHEIGIRMALGATPTSVLWMVLRQGIVLVVVGLAFGVAGSLALTRFMSGLLFGIEPTDPMTFLAVSLVLVTVAVTACLVPARRATVIDPMTALRCE